MQEQEVKVRAVEGSQHGGGEVPGGDELLRFTEASCGNDPDVLDEARTRLTGAVGVEAMIDGAAVAGAFQMMNRVANATGTPLDDQLVGITAGVRAELDLNYLSTPEGMDTKDT